MVRRALIALALVAAGVPAPAALAAGGYVTAPGGPRLLDAQGRALQLHGVNLVAKCPADSHPSPAPGTPCIPGAAAGPPEPGYVLSPTAADLGRRFTDADAATLERLGFTTVRLGVVWAGLEPGDARVGANDPRFCSPHAAGAPYPALGGADPWRPAVADAYLRRVDVVVRLLERHGIRPVIDMHQDAWGRPFANAGGATPWMAEGAPAWATCTDGTTTASTSASWTGAYLDGSTLAAFAHLWANDVSGDLQRHFDRVWAYVAAHYRADRKILGYEVVNEPADQTAVVPAEFDRKLECFYAGTRYAPDACRAAFYPAPAQGRAEGAIPAIEAADPDHLVFFETHSLSNDGTPTTIGDLGELPFKHLVFSFHVYPLDAIAGPAYASDGYRCDAPTCQAEEERIVAEYSAERAAMRTAQPGGPAWMLTEFGAHDYAPDLDHVAAVADRYGLGWMEWAALQLHDPTGMPREGLLDERTREPDPARAAVLARTYPRATAGTPLAQSFDSATGAFSFAYRPDPAISAPTEIVVPTDVHYPRGYDVAVSGGRATSAPGARLLTIQPDPGAVAVSVRVSAR